MDDDLNQAALALKSEWELELPELVSEALVMEHLTRRVMMLLQQGEQQFYQLMYRLDISEKKLNQAAGGPDVAENIARLIYNRQLEKAASRRHFRNQNNDVDTDLKW